MGVGRIFTSIGLVGGGRSRAKKKGRRGAAPRSVGRYLLEESIGAGAFGEVWRAVDPHITRHVAVKILNIPKGLSRKQRTEWEQRFLREARAAGALSHPGIVTIHDVGVARDGRPFMVMELVDGVSLDTLLSRRPPPEATALEWGAQIAEALGAAHRRGIVHRDVKPANVLIDREGRARIADFGIARLSESDLTREGLFVGSPAFASPEQIRGGTVDGRSDLFSLGSALYTLLCGERPFRGEDLTSLAYTICHVEPAPLRRVAPKLSSACEAVVMKMLTKDPGGRYQSGEELAEDLRLAAAGRAPKQASLVRRVESTVVGGQSATTAGGTPEGAGPRRRAARGDARPVGLAGGAALAIVLLMAIGAGVIGSSLLTRGSDWTPAGLASAGMPAVTPRQALPAEAPRTGTSMLVVRLTHDLRDGVVTIGSGSQRLLQEPFESLAPGSVVFMTGRAPVDADDEWDTRVPEGDQVLHVEVNSPSEGIDLTGDLPMTVEKDHRYVLNVRVRRHPSPKLDLMWAGD